MRNGSILFIIQTEVISLLLVNCVCSHKETRKVMLTGAWNNLTTPEVIGGEATNEIRRTEPMIKRVYLGKKKKLKELVF